ncbi:hypothetical protein ACFSM5_00510 [Lacibacterium aquatile]|uniref:Uncharacterized protein n=1 Tax=Lacibacterium aquatile TaxID=1168082 RepID=A0ABW5DJS5_9PROT
MTDRTFETSAAGVASAASAARQHPLAMPLALAGVFVFASLTMRELIPDWLAMIVALHAAAVGAARRREVATGNMIWGVFVLQALALLWLALSLRQGLEWPEVELAIFSTTAIATLAFAGWLIVRVVRKLGV